MPNPEDQYRRVVKKGDYSFTVTEVMSGTKKGSYKVQGRVDGQWKEIGTYKCQKKSLARAKEKAMAMSVGADKLLSLAEDERDMCIAAVEGGVTLDEIKHLVKLKTSIKDVSLGLVISFNFSRGAKRPFPTWVR